MPDKDLSTDDGYEVLLVEAGRAATQAVNSARYQGPAVEQNAHATMHLLKVVERLGIDLGELRDAFARAQRETSAAAVGRDFAELGALIETAREALATGPEELGERLQRAKNPAAAQLDPPAAERPPITQSETVVRLTGANAARLVEAAKRAGVTPVEFATAAVLRAVSLVMGPEL